MPAETALITGASSGIGLELAELFARDKSNLVLVARSEDKLHSLAERLRREYGVTVQTITKDLSLPGAAVELVQQLRDSQTQIDALVNNAGFGGIGYFDEIADERHRAMLNVNVQTLTELTRLLIPDMLARRRGCILNLGSTASFQPGPNSAVYYASKAYVLSFTHALAMELKGTGVTATCLCPGPTRTGFADEASMKDTLVFRMNSMDVKPVALAGYRGMRNGRVEVVPGVFNWYFAYLGKISPWWIVRRVTQRLQALPPRSSGR
jgi:short-subunit dehydrogenase